MTWEAMQGLCGGFTFAVGIAAVVAFCLAVAAFVGALRRRSAAWVPLLTGLALASVAVAASTGLLGTWLVDLQLRELASGTRWTELGGWERVAELLESGTPEAGKPSRWASLTLVVPALLALAALAVTLVRTALAWTQRGLLLAAGGLAVLAWAGDLEGFTFTRRAGRLRAEQVLEDAARSAVGTVECDTCRSLDEVARGMGFEWLESVIPSARDLARQCVEEWIVQAESGRPSGRPPCPATPTANSSAIPLVRIDRPTSAAPADPWRFLLDSPLLRDPELRSRAEAAWRNRSN